MMMLLLVLLLTAPSIVIETGCNGCLVCVCIDDATQNSPERARRCSPMLNMGHAQSYRAYTPMGKTPGPSSVAQGPKSYIQLSSGLSNSSSDIGVHASGTMCPVSSSHEDLGSGLDSPFNIVCLCLRIFLVVAHGSTSTACTTTCSPALRS